MKACKFSFEYGPDFDGFAHETTWNGFDNVSVTPETRDAIVSWIEGDKLYEDALDLALLPVGFDGLISLANGWATTITAIEE